MTALAVRATGRHRLPWWRRVARELRRGQLKANAGRIARAYAVYIPAALLIQSVSVAIPSLPMVFTAIGLTGALFLIGWKL